MWERQPDSEDSRSEPLSEERLDLLNLFALPLDEEPRHPADRDDLFPNHCHPIWLKSQGTWLEVHPKRAKKTIVYKVVREFDVLSM